MLQGEVTCSSLMGVKGLRDLISDDPKSVTNLPPLPEWRGILLLLYLKILHKCLMILIALEYHQPIRPHALQEKSNAGQ